MYIYCDKSISNPLYIHFLCGNQYNSKNTKDKRNILKEYIDAQNNNYALILEKLFDPTEYTDMGFKDLEEVEIMASYYAKSIIILHETVSTAAEIALFGSKEELREKVLVIYAPKEKIETDSVGAFIRLAYFKNNKVTESSFNFSTRLYQEKGKKIAYYNTFFPDDTITDEFEKTLTKFWNKTPNVLKINLTKESQLYYKDNTYLIDENTKAINVKINYELILSIVICILLNNKLIKDKRNKDLVVKKVCAFFKDLMKDTISNNEVKNLDNYSIKITTINNQEINLPIKFCIYVLEKSGLIKIHNDEISITNNFKEKCKEYKDLIIYKEESNFFEGE